LFCAIASLVSFLLGFVIGHPSPGFPKWWGEGGGKDPRPKSPEPDPDGDPLFPDRIPDWMVSEVKKLIPVRRKDEAGKS
jgi:hypothetical protein